MEDPPLTNLDEAVPSTEILAPASPAVPATGSHEQQQPQAQQHFPSLASSTNLPFDDVAVASIIPDLGGGGGHGGGGGADDDGHVAAVRYDLKTQIIERFGKNWSLEEERTLLDAYRMWGPDWPRIEALLPARKGIVSKWKRLVATGHDEAINIQRQWRLVRDRVQHEAHLFRRQMAINSGEGGGEPAPPPLGAPAVALAQKRGLGVLFGAGGAGDENDTGGNSDHAGTDGSANVGGGGNYSAKRIRTNEQPGDDAAKAIASANAATFAATETIVEGESEGDRMFRRMQEILVANAEQRASSNPQIWSSAMNQSREISASEYRSLSLHRGAGGGSGGGGGGGGRSEDGGSVNNDSHHHHHGGGDGLGFDGGASPRSSRFYIPQNQRSENDSSRVRPGTSVNLPFLVLKPYEVGRIMTRYQNSRFGSPRSRGSAVGLAGTPCAGYSLVWSASASSNATTCLTSGMAMDSHANGSSFISSAVSGASMQSAVHQAVAETVGLPSTSITRNEDGSLILRPEYAIVNFEGSGGPTTLIPQDEQSKVLYGGGTRSGKYRGIRVEMPQHNNSENGVENDGIFQSHLPDDENTREAVRAAANMMQQGTLRHKKVTIVLDVPQPSLPKDTPSLDDPDEADAWVSQFAETYAEHYAHAYAKTILEAYYRGYLEYLQILNNPPSGNTTGYIPSSYNPLQAQPQRQQQQQHAGGENSGSGSGGSGRMEHMSFSQMGAGDGGSARDQHPNSNGSTTTTSSTTNGTGAEQQRNHLANVSIPVPASENSFSSSSAQGAVPPSIDTAPPTADYSTSTTTTSSTSTTTTNASSSMADPGKDRIILATSIASHPYNRPQITSLNPLVASHLRLITAGRANRAATKIQLARQDPSSSSSAGSFSREGKSIVESPNNDITTASSTANQTVSKEPSSGNEESNNNNNNNKSINNDSMNDNNNNISHTSHNDNSNDTNMAPGASAE